MGKRAFVRVIAVLASLAVGASMAATADAAPKPPQPKPAYVALGDSYAAGVGAGSYLSDGTSCHRSLLGYPGLVATAGGFNLNLQACSGAITSDVLDRQLGTLSDTTAKVTITIGGNDIGFADVITTCLGTNTEACLNAVAAAKQQATSELPTKLGSVYSAVKTRAPNATIVATDYPRLFNGSDCSILTSFTGTEMAALNDGANTLAGVIKTAASASGIGYVNVQPPFVGHALCDATPWINNASLFDQFESFHPNASGYKYGYTPVVSPALGVGGTKPGKGKPTVTTGGTTSSDTRRGEVRVDAAKG